MKRYSETERRRLVRAFDESGESAAAFCRRQGVTAVTLAQWRKRYSPPAGVAASPGPRPKPQSGPSWLPVVLSDGAGVPAGPDGPLYRMGRGDLRLEVPAGFDPGEVRQLWELLVSAVPEGGSRVTADSSGFSPFPLRP